MNHVSGIRGGVLAALALLLVQPAPGASQIRGSELGSVSQTLDGTTITVEYSRPTARGRDLFGGLVPWGVVWTPGANWATTLEADKDIRLNGVEVPAGKYSVWMIPRTGPWTLTLNQNPELFHFQKPDSADDQIHIAVDPEEGPHTEMLTWSFPSVSGDAAILRMAWGSTSVPVEVLVQPTRPVALAPEDRAMFVGRYEMSVLPGIGYPEQATFEVTERDGVLRGRLPFPIHPGDELDFDLVPAGMNRFSPGLYQEGRLFNIEQGVAFEFEVGDRAGGVVMRGVEGTAFGTAVRADDSARKPGAADAAGRDR
ncbi:MAG TPA: DUF2911 domain-containing protein [Longimicrobiales bacterium]|nr:DUF2911 domain-containing protein [Longimicrobiales bacterium]